MVETIQKNGMWNVRLVENDLVKQAGLNPKDFEQDFGFFRYKGRVVIVSHTFKENLVVSMEGEEDVDQKLLIDGFSKVVEYQPFCKYILLLPPQEKGSKAPPPLLTYEWDKIDPNGRLGELNKDKNVSKLVKISPNKK